MPTYLSKIYMVPIDLIGWFNYWKIVNFGPKSEVIVLKNRIVMPHRWTGPNSIRMGSYDSAGKMDAQTGLHRRYDPLRLYRLGIPHPEVHQPSDQFERGIYAGPLLPAYGHFILESLARLWATAEYPDWPIIFSVDERTNAATLKPWMRELLTVLGVLNPVILITRPTWIDQLLVPAPGYEIQYRFAKHHASFLGRVEWRPTAGKKLWVSRANLATNAASCDGRAEMEAALLSDGWQIMHPQSLSIEEQLDHFATAERVAGEQGSALHNIIFLRSALGLRLDAFARDPMLTGHRINHNQATICTHRHVEYRLHRITQEVVLSRNGAHMGKKYAQPDVYLSHLNNP